MNKLFKEGCNNFYIIIVSIIAIYMSAENIIYILIKILKNIIYVFWKKTPKNIIFLAWGYYILGEDMILRNKINNLTLKTIIFILIMYYLVILIMKL